MINKLLAGTALAVVPVAAMAADLPVRTAAPAPVFVAAAPSWTGFYVGVNGGLLWDSHNKSDQCALYGTDYDPYCLSTGDWYQGLGSGSALGGLIGLTAGYNWQSGNIVFGLEGDIGIVGGAKHSVGSEFMNASAETRALGTIRGRVGIASGNSLFYVTAGAAAVQRKLKVGMVDYDCADYLGKCGSKSQWNWQAVVGAGIEHQLGGGWSAKVEALYIPKDTITLSRVDSDGYGKRFSSDVSTGIVRFGVNYRFGAAARTAPVVARY